MSRLKNGNVTYDTTCLRTSVRVPLLGSYSIHKTCLLSFCLQRSSLIFRADDGLHWRELPWGAGGVHQTVLWLCHQSEACWSWTGWIPVWQADSERLLERHRVLVWHVLFNLMGLRLFSPTQDDIYIFFTQCDFSVSFGLQRRQNCYPVVWFKPDFDCRYCPFSVLKRLNIKGQFHGNTVVFWLNHFFRNKKPFSTFEIICSSNVLTRACRSKYVNAIRTAVTLA